MWIWFLNQAQTVHDVSAIYVVHLVMVIGDLVSMNMFFFEYILACLISYFEFVFVLASRAQ